jgi:pyruvate formate lyase activating enzyme
VFYDKSGGGVTLSGGEPALQDEFAAALMGFLKEKEIHVALDTCGGISWQKLGPLVELADLVLYDLKIMEEDAHLRHTGIPLRLVLDNACAVAAAGKPMWVRTPIIPGYTDDEENIRAIARFVVDNLPNVERYDLLAFNNTCHAKYRRLDRIFPLAGEALLAEEVMEKLTAAAAAEGLSVARWSGAAASRKGG